jgi:acyl carrier protein
MFNNFTGWVVAAVGLFAVFGGVWYVGFLNKRLALRHMHGRPPLDDTQFGHELFSPDKAAIATKLRQLLTRHLAVDLSRLQPGDRFIKDLRMDELDSLSTVEYVMEIEKEFGIEISDSDAEKMLTFGQVVDYVAQKCKEKTV